MKQFIKNIILLAIVVSLALDANAQQIQASAALDTNSMLIGDQVNLKLSLQLPEDTPYVWPIFTDTLAKDLEIIKKSPIDTTQGGNGFLNIKQTLTLSAFDSGYYVVPPVRFKFGSSFSDSIETEPYLLNVFTVEVDTTLAIKPIKGPIAVPLTFREILPWLLLGIAVLLLSFGIYYLWKKKNAKQPISFKKPKPKLPPHKIALDALEKLKAEKLWQQDFIKPYYSRLSDILRVYIEDRYQVNAVEMTTFEIIAALKSVDIQTNLKTNLREILELSDLVKFAKAKPLPDEHDMSMTGAVEFVKNTIQVQSSNLHSATSQQQNSAHKSAANQESYNNQKN